MLLDLREKVRSSKPIKYTLITVISIPFALVGIGSYFSGGTAEPVATVEGEEIGQQELDRAYNQQRQQLAQAFGGQLPEGFANEGLMRQQALEGLISQRVVNSVVRDEGFAVGDATLARQIRELPVFQVDGQFDDQTYRNQLRSNGMSIPQFEQQFRDDTAISQFRDGIAATSFVLAEEQTRLDALQRQQRRVDILRYSLADARELETVSDEDAQAWFNDNAEQFMWPQRSKLAYIELDASNIADGIDVSDSEAQAWYDDNRLSYMRPEARSASHILLELDDADDEDEVAEKRATLTDLRNRIEAGESFEALAAEFSTDIGSADAGGSLGEIAPGVMDSTFEEILYALPADGDLSEPVLTDFGLHLIRLDEIKPETGEAFETVKDDIIQTLKQNEADREFFELREQLAEFSFDNPASLDAASDATGLPIVNSDWVDEDTEDQPVLTHPAVLQAAISADVLEDGNNSDIIEVAERHIVVLRVLEHEDERPKEFTDVSEEVIDSVRSERAGAALDEQVAADVEALANGDDVEALAEASELVTATAGQTLERNSADLDRIAIADIFQLSRPEEGATPTGNTTLPGGDRLAYRLLEVVVPEPADDAEAITANVAPSLGGIEFQAVVDSLRSNADVSIAE